MVFILCFSCGPAVIGLLGSSGEKLSWLLLIVFSCWLLTIWVGEDCNSKCSCLCCVGVCSLVSVALSGSYEGVVAVYCLVENSSQILIGVAKGEGSW